MPSELVQRWRAKYPGAYDDMSDVELESAILKKHPEYEDIATPKGMRPITALTTQSIPDPSQLESPLANVANRTASIASGMAHKIDDLKVGALKGAGQTVTNFGTLARKIPGVSSLDKLMTPIEFSTTSTNTTQAIGKGAEQIAEFMLPATRVGNLTKGASFATRAAAQAGVGGAMTGVQTLDPEAAVESAALSGVMPYAGAAMKWAAPKAANWVMNRTIRPAAHIRDKFMTKEGAEALGLPTTNGPNRFGVPGVMEAIRKENVYSAAGAEKKLASAIKDQEGILDVTERIVDESGDGLAYVETIKDILKKNAEKELAPHGLQGNFFDRLDSYKELSGTAHEAANRLSDFMKRFVYGENFVSPAQLQQMKQEAQKLAYDSTLSDLNKSYYQTLSKVLQQTLEDISSPGVMGQYGEHLQRSLAEVNPQIQRLMVAKEAFQRAEERPNVMTHMFSIPQAIGGAAFGHPFAGIASAGLTEIMGNPAVGTAAGQGISQFRHVGRPAVQRGLSAAGNELLKLLLGRELDNNQR